MVSGNLPVAGWRGDQWGPKRPTGKAIGRANMTVQRSSAGKFNDPKGDADPRDADFLT